MSLPFRRTHASGRTKDDVVSDQFRIDAAMTDWGTLTLRVSGDLELATAEGLGDELAEWLGIHECVVDLSDCHFIDSSGIRALVACKHDIGPDATLRVIGVAPNVERTLRLAGVDSLLELAPSNQPATT
jgi:anti-sigma B factor antagonist